MLHIWQDWSTRIQRASAQICDISSSILTVFVSFLCCMPVEPNQLYVYPSWEKLMLLNFLNICSSNPPVHCMQMIMVYHIHNAFRTARIFHVWVASDLFVYIYFVVNLLCG